MTLASGIVNDLLALDPAGSAWADLSGQLVGAPPSPRTSQGAASVGSTFYVFGGFGTGGFFAFRAKTLCHHPPLPSSPSLLPFLQPAPSIHPSLPLPPPFFLPFFLPVSLPPALLPTLAPSLSSSSLLSLSLFPSLPLSIPFPLSLILASRVPSLTEPQQHRFDGSGTEQRNSQREQTAQR